MTSGVAQTKFDRGLKLLQAVFWVIGGTVAILNLIELNRVNRADVSLKIIDAAENWYETESDNFDPFVSLALDVLTGSLTKDEHLLRARTLHGNDSDVTVNTLNLLELNLQRSIALGDSDLTEALFCPDVWFAWVAVEPLVASIRNTGFAPDLFETIENQALACDLGG